MRSPTLPFLTICRDKVYEVLSKHNQYRNEITEAEEALRRKEKGYKAPVKPREVKAPAVKSKFLAFSVNLMVLKTLLFKHGYSDYWSKWSLIKLCDVSLLLMVQGFTI